MGIRRLFYIGGIIPTILGGGTLGWWFGQDKTIEDALRRIGKVPFKTQTEFEKVYEKYKDSDGFKSNIPNASSWKDISKWCETKLRLELNKENIKKVFDKVLKYCTEFEETGIESKKLPKFGGLMSIISDNTKKDSARREAILAFVYDGNYYCANNVVDINNKTSFSKCQPPKQNYSLYFEPHKRLNKHGTNHNWKNMIGRYLQKGNPLDIKITITSRKDWDSKTKGYITVQEENNSQTQNALAARCDSLLKETFTNKEEYEKGLINFVTWCTETGLKEESLNKFRSERSNVS